MKKLVLENRIQKALFECMMMGQISDGKWENSNPYGHYKPWGEAIVEVGEDVGRNFHARKDNYNLVAKDLMDIIGDELVAIANMADKGYDMQTIRRFADYYEHDRIDLRVDIGMSEEELIEAYKDNYWVKKHEQMIEEFGSLENLDEARSGRFDLKLVKDELRRMKKIFRIKK